MMTVFRSQVRSLDDLSGPAGRLEAVLNTGQPGAPMSALVCHPHPKGGGTLHNKVVYHTMKALASFGIPVLRFNFRGVGLSAGQFDEGIGEQDDVRAALDWLDHEYRQPILFAGFSFGSHVGLRACCGDTRVRGLIALGLPVAVDNRIYRYEFLGGCQAPKLFVTGAEDAFAPRMQQQILLEGAPDPKQITWIDGADHFFNGVPGSPEPKLPPMQQAVRAWVHQQFGLTDAAPLDCSRLRLIL